MDNINTCFYLSTNTSSGYSPIFSKACSPFSDNRTYIITGAGKSLRQTLIEKITAELIKEGFDCEKIISPVDNGIEGVIFKELDICIFDGHRAELPILDICDCTQYVINLSNFCETGELYSLRKEISQYCIESGEHNKKCIKFLNAASTMREDILRVIGDCLSAEKLEKYINRFTEKEFGTVSDVKGKTDFRYLNAVTPDGINTLYETVNENFSKIYLLDDKTGCVSEPFINQLKESAVNCGYDIIICPDPINPNICRYLLIPELSMAIITSDEIIKWNGDYTKKISSSRFTDREIIKSHRGRVRFNIEAINELTSQAFMHMDKVKKITEKIDLIYNEHTDINNLESIIFKIKSDILSEFKIQ